ncbi:unnamed protein product [Dibothriocephalus latus]|uniref:Uncharacterized protein n=1 Tax=Dibothriocephalus latus TaxID=60516 RepID=A0A3P7P719_DIBLA|nr:unnamed protein product [Dibothriocephalus latus]
MNSMHVLSDVVPDTGQIPVLELTPSSAAFSSLNGPPTPLTHKGRLCPMDSPARLTFGQTYDLSVNVVEANINMHNASPVVEEEACIDVDIALLSSLGSEGGVSMNSICWKSMVSVSSPEEMRLHGPLQVRSTKDPIASSKVRKLRCAQKKRAHLSLQHATELYAPTKFELCVGYVTCVRQLRHSHKRESNLKKSTIGVTAPCQGDAISIHIWGDDIGRDTFARATAGEERGGTNGTEGLRVSALCFLNLLCIFLLPLLFADLRKRIADVTASCQGDAIGAPVWGDGIQDEQTATTRSVSHLVRSLALRVSEYARLSMKVRFPLPDLSLFRFSLDRLYRELSAFFGGSLASGPPERNETIGTFRILTFVPLPPTPPYSTVHT